MGDENKIKADEFLETINGSPLKSEIEGIIGWLRNFKRKQALAREAEEILEARVRDYQKSRLAHLIATVHSGSEEWCTYCSKIFVAATLKPIYIEEGEFEPGKHNPWIRDRKLHRVCPECFELLREKSGQYGDLD